MIKAFAILCIVFGSLGLLAVAGAVMTRPADDEIYSAIADEATGDEPLLSWALQQTAVNRHTIKIVDRLIYKDIYSSLDGSHVGRAYFGTVNLD